MAITEVWVKVYPCCGAIHSTLSALESLKREYGFAPAEVGEIHVHSSNRCVTQNGGRDPQDTMSAQYSIPFCVGVAVAKDPRDPASFADSGRNDPVVRGLAARTVLAVDPEIDRMYPGRLGARVVVRLNDGREVSKEVLDPPGSHADPCAPAEIEDKFRRLAASVKPREAVERIVETVRRLPASVSLAELSRALREKNIESVAA